MLLIDGIPACVVLLDAILDIRPLGDDGGFVSPGDDGRRVEGRRYPAVSVVVGDLGAKLGGDLRIIDSDLLRDNASAPDGVKIVAAWSLNGDEVPVAVIVERDVQRLMNAFRASDPEARNASKLITLMVTLATLIPPLHDELGTQVRCLGMNLRRL